MNLKNLTLLLICFSIHQSFIAQNQSSAPKYSNEFLQIGIGADALGMSNAVVAKTGDVNSGYWNPAGLTRLDRGFEIGAMHSEYFAGIAKYDYVGFAKTIDRKSTFGVSFVRFAVDDIPNTTQLIDNKGNFDYDRITTFTAADYAMLFSYARKLNTRGLSVGGNIKVIHRKVGDFAKSWGFGLDAGLQYKKNDNWQFGVIARDASSTFNAWIFSLDQTMKDVFNMTGNEIPENGMELTLPRIIGGVHTRYPLFKSKIYLGGELDLAITTDKRRNTLIQSNFASVDPYMGIELGFENYFELRFGIGNMQYIKDFDDSKKLTLQPNIGVGVQIKNFKLDYAFTDLGDQSTALYSHVISLKVRMIK